MWIYLSRKLSNLLENNKEENKYGSLIYELIYKILELYSNYSKKIYCELSYSTSKIVANI